MLETIFGVVVSAIFEVPRAVFLAVVAAVIAAVVAGTPVVIGLSALAGGLLGLAGDWWSRSGVQGEGARD